MSIARSITTLYRNPVPVLIHAIRTPLPAPSSSTEVSIPPSWATLDILLCQGCSFKMSYYNGFYLLLQADISVFNLHGRANVNLNAEQARTLSVYRIVVG